MKQHAKWWKRVYSSLIRNKTRREISEASWLCCLNWVQAEAVSIELGGEGLVELMEKIAEERDSE